MFSLAVQAILNGSASFSLPLSLPLPFFYPYRPPNLNVYWRILRNYSNSFSSATPPVRVSMFFNPSLLQSLNPSSIFFPSIPTLFLLVLFPPRPIPRSLYPADFFFRCVLFFILLLTPIIITFILWAIDPNTHYHSFSLFFVSNSLLHPLEKKPCSPSQISSKRLRSLYLELFVSISRRLDKLRFRLAYLYTYYP